MDFLVTVAKTRVALNLVDVSRQIPEEAKILVFSVVCFSLLRFLVIWISSWFESFEMLCLRDQLRWIKHIVSGLHGVISFTGVITAYFYFPSTTTNPFSHLFKETEPKIWARCYMVSIGYWIFDSYFLFRHYDAIGSVSLVFHHVISILPIANVFAGCSMYCAIRCLLNEGSDILSHFQWVVCRIVEARAATPSTQKLRCLTPRSSIVSAEGSIFRFFPDAYEVGALASTPYAVSRKLFPSKKGIAEDFPTPRSGSNDFDELYRRTSEENVNGDKSTKLDSLLSTVLRSSSVSWADGICSPRSSSRKFSQSVYSEGELYQDPSGTSGAEADDAVAYLRDPFTSPEAVKSKKAPTGLTVTVPRARKWSFHRERKWSLESPSKLNWTKPVDSGLGRTAQIMHTMNNFIFAATRLIHCPAFTFGVFGPDMFRCLLSGSATYTTAQAIVWISNFTIASLVCVLNVYWGMGIIGKFLAVLRSAFRTAEIKKKVAAKES